MAWLPEGEKISKISLLVLAQLTDVTDTYTQRETDRHTPHDGIDRAYASHRAAKTNEPRLAANWHDWSTRQQQQHV